MRWLMLLAFVAFIFVLIQLANAQTPAFELQPGQSVLPAIQFKQLAIFPIVQKATAAVDKTRFLTLSEGLAQKLVAVAEEGRGGTVNRVHVTNKSDRPLILLGGEVILGGQQDRILGKDTVVPAHEEMALEVFCVEHGRWNGGREFTASGGMAEGKMRVRAKYRSNQQEVWAEVAKKNGALNVQNATGTYRNLATGAEGEKAKKPYRDHFAAQLGKLPDHDKLVGLVAAVNGRVTSVDLFASPSLFAAYQDKLLDSIVMSAVDVPVAAKPDPVRAADIKQFVDKAQAAAPKEVAKSKAGRTVEKAADDVLNSTIEVQSAPAAPAVKVYESYQRNE
jgi:hypothetical protein